MSNHPKQPGDDLIVEFGDFISRPENKQLIGSPATAARWLRESPERLPATFKSGKKRFTTVGAIRVWRARLLASARDAA